jgi:hypothetical protein
MIRAVDSCLNPEYSFRFGHTGKGGYYANQSRGKQLLSGAGSLRTVDWYSQDFGPATLLNLHLLANSLF